MRLGCLLCARCVSTACLKIDKILDENVKSTKTRFPLPFANPPNQYSLFFPRIHHPSHSAASAIQPEITLSRKQKTQQEKRLSSHHPRRKKMPNHHLGCGYVDAWSRVMLLQFPSRRLFSFFLHYFPFLRAPFLRS